MKIKLSIIYLFFLTSCTSSYITVLNETKNSIETITVLTKKDQSNFNLTYTDIISKNQLNQPLKPNESIKIKKSGYTSIIGLTKNFDSYIESNIQKNEIAINNLDYNTDTAMSLAEPIAIKLKISNQSDFIIKKVNIEFYYPLSKKTKKESIMKFWNVIFPNTVADIKFNYYPSSSLYKIKTVIIESSLGNEIFERKYTENFQDLIIFEK